MKKVFYISAIFNFLFFTSAFAQSALVKQWDYRFGGTSFDFLYTLQQTKDGGYILGGESFSGISGDKTQASNGSVDYWIVKTDPNGIYQWDKGFGGSNADQLYSIQQTSDGGYILGGISSSPVSGDKTLGLKGALDYWIVKVDSLGTKQWDMDFGGASTSVSELKSLQQTKDGGYILGGYTNSGIGGDKTDSSRGYYDYWIIKTDSLGNSQWDKTFGGDSTDDLYSLQQTKDGGYILGGYSVSPVSGDKTQPCFGSYDYWIVKIDSLGNKQWDKTFGGDTLDQLYSLQQTKDGGYILGGSSLSGIGGDKTQASFGSFDYWIVKTDSLGNKQWDKDFGGTSADEFIGSLFLTSDGGYLLSGTSYSPISGTKTENNLGGPEQTWIVKTDSLGSKKWDKTLFTSGGSNDDEVGFGIQSQDGCYVFANETYAGTGGYKTQPSRGGQDYWIIKFCDSTAQALPVSNFSASQNVFCEGGGCINFYDSSSGNPTSWQWYFPGASPNVSNAQNPTGICYSNSGTYTVTLIVANGAGSDTLTISPMIIVSAGVNQPVVIASDDTLLSSHAATYQWYLNGSPIAGGTDSFYVCSQGGTYSVQITDSLGCSALSQGVYNSCITRIEFTIYDLQFTVYPNPASKEFTVYPARGGFVVQSMLEIYNVFGEQIYSAKLNSKKANVNCSQWATGVYILKIIPIEAGENGTSNMKIIIK